MKKLIERFEEKYFVSPDGCWLWTACVDKDGYGRIGVGGRGGGMSAAHRASYELFVGKIPEKFHIDHLCRQPACVNPHHLEAVTQAENTRRGSKTHKICKHGSGWSECKSGCSSEYHRNYKLEKRAKNINRG